MIVPGSRFSMSAASWVRADRAAASLPGAIVKNALLMYMTLLLCVVLQVSVDGMCSGAVNARAMIVGGGLAVPAVGKLRLRVIQRFLQSCERGAPSTTAVAGSMPTRCVPMR